MCQVPGVSSPPPPEWNKELVYPFNLSVLSGVLGTRIYLTYLSYAVCQVPGCMPRLSGSRSHATTGSRPPSGPWASCCMTWSAGTSPSRVTSRSVSPTSGRERRERERERVKQQKMKEIRSISYRHDSKRSVTTENLCY